MSTLKIFQIISISFPIAFALSFICRGKRANGLSYGQVLAGLLVKIFLGAAYGFIFLKFYGGDDTWLYFQESLIQTELLKTNPIAFLRELTPVAAIRNYPGALQTVEAYLHDLEFYLQVKLLAVFNLFSFSDYYIDMCLLNGIFFFGHYWLYRLLIQRYNGNRNWTFAAVFLFIPAVFWLSGIRSDGFLFVFVMLTLFSLNRLLGDEKMVSSFVGLGIGMAGMVIFRAGFALLLLPALIAWILVERGGRRPGLALGGVYGVCLMLTLLSLLISPNKNAATSLVERQAAFLSLNGNTRFHMEPMEPTIESIGLAVPKALVNTFLRPFPWEARGALQWASCGENILFISILVLLLYRMKMDDNRWYADGFVLAVTAWLMSVYIISGLTVPFPGALVRYKSIAEMLLLATIAARSIKNT